MLPSKNMIVVDISNGLFVLDATKAYYPETNTVKAATKAIKLETYPNPSTDAFYLKVPEGLKGPMEVRIVTLSGQLVYQNILEASLMAKHRFNTNTYSPGTYIITLKHGKDIYSSEQIIVK